MRCPADGGWVSNCQFELKKCGIIHKIHYTAGLLLIVARWLPYTIHFLGIACSCMVYFCKRIGPYQSESWLLAPAPAICLHV